MPRTTLDTVQMALRRLGILSADETPSADEYSFSTATLETLFEELKDIHGMAFTWTLDVVPDNAFLPLSHLLAVEISQHYGVQAEPRTRALARLNAVAFPDDRDDRRDTDDDGIVSADEAAAGLKAAYF